MGHSTGNRRAIALLLILLLLVTLLAAGCGTSAGAEMRETAAATAEPETETEPAAAAEPAEPVPETQTETVPEAENENRTEGQTTGTEDAPDDRSAAAETQTQLPSESGSTFRLSDVPAYTGSAFVQMNGNRPYFSEDDLTTSSYECYGALDAFGRCTVCIACVGTDLMPTEERGSIGQVKPTGWHTVKYDCVDGKYLYNRCHLIGYQLTGENANACNLITGTRYMNLNMLDYENLIAEYVEDYDAHLLYRVTPVFAGDNLLASGVLMEGMSVEDCGESVCFCVFLYNVQPGIVIDYATGESREGDTVAETQLGTEETESGEDVTTGIAEGTYILNTNTRKFHLPTCPSAENMKESNKQVYTGTRASVIEMGYEPCGNCNP